VLRLVLDTNVLISALAIQEETKEIWYLRRRRETENGARKMTKTMSIRMDRENYEFLTEISKEERSDLSKAVRDLVVRGRVPLAVERYKKGNASLGKAAQLAGLSVGQMMTLLAEFGVESRMEKDDYFEGLKNLANAW
jgi:predicted HTH domain antitoxin